LNLSAHPSDVLHRINTIIERNCALAYDLGITGTPGFLVGSELQPGALDLNGLKDLIAWARHGK
jgi:protein-disulfide isomerase